MTPQQVIGIAIRIVAIFFWISSLSYISTLLASLYSTLPESKNIVHASILGGFTFIFTGLTLWIFPMAIAHKLLPRTHYDNLLTALPAREYARMGCALVGLWLFAKASASLAWFVLRAYLVFDGGSVFSNLTLENKAELLVSIFELGLSVLLIAKSSDFAKFVFPANPDRHLPEPGEH
jgi:hypothetical protein